MAKKHQDKNVKAPAKLYCEPVYPDLTQINNDLPANLMQEAEIPESEMKDEGNMNFSIDNETLIKYGYSDLVSFLETSDAIEELRQREFNPEEHRKAFKTPSAGKPANNNDPFPIDVKIEELEMHQPRTKIESINNVCPEAVSTAIACVELSANVERRLVKIENNLATIMRYIARLSSRVPINCVYYGGQTNKEKYKCIRCLTDDRLQDGQLVTIDQCLNCTRYEPLIGQTYEILNDVGVNLSQILDDCQMSYTTMDEYCNFVDPSKYQKDLETVKLDVANKNIRDINEKDFFETWGNGIAMDWNLVPVEDQSPHISFQEQAQVLDSYYGSALNNGTDYASTANYSEAASSAAGSISGIAYSNKIVYNKELMDNILEESASSFNEDGTVRHHFAYEAITEMKELVESRQEEYVDDMKAYLSRNITDLIKNSNYPKLDNILVAAIVCATDHNADEVIEMLGKKTTELKSYGVDNVILTIALLSMDPKFLVGANTNIEDKTFPRRLDKVTKLVISEDPETGTSTETEVSFNLDWGKVDTWDWVNFVEPLQINYTGDQREPSVLISTLSMFVKIVYTYAALMSKCSTSSYDHNGFAFPIFEEDLNKVSYTSPYGQRWGTIHRGIDLAAAAGIPIHAIADGTVVYAWPADGDGGGNRCCIQHANNISSAYMHMLKLEVSNGQSISKGQVIGHIGYTGHCEPAGPAGAHLHFQIQEGGITGRYAKDPCLWFPRLKAVPLGETLDNSK